MAQRLSRNTSSSPFIYLGGCLLVVTVCLWLGHTYIWLALAWLGLLVVQAPRFWYYSLTLTADELRLRRWFTPLATYPLAYFRALELTDKTGRPVRISFADGCSYLFEPKLKESALALRYVPVAGFVAYWNERLREPAEFKGQVWPDDLI